jgi:hypothetical protein
MKKFQIIVMCIIAVVLIAILVILLETTGKVANAPTIENPNSFLPASTSTPATATTTPVPASQTPKKVSPSATVPPVKNPTPTTEPPVINPVPETQPPAQDLTKHFCTPEQKASTNGCSNLLLFVCGHQYQNQCAGPSCEKLAISPCSACSDPTIEYWTLGRCPNQ